jgi:hypothetical protein
MAEWLMALAWKACIRETVSWVRIPLPPPTQNRTANASRPCARGIGKRLKQIAFRADDTDLLVRDLDALGEGAKMISAIAASLDPHPLTRSPGELADHLRCDCL